MVPFEQVNKFSMGHKIVNNQILRFSRFGFRNRKEFENHINRLTIVRIKRIRPRFTFKEKPRKAIFRHTELLS